MIYNVNKSLKWTSFDVVAKVRRVLGIKKVGHAGTLDPLATGVLIVLTMEDTRIQDEIMHQDKEYVAEIAFGADTPSYDLEFTPEFVGIPNYEPEAFKKDLHNCITTFVGHQKQIVPNYSAKKIQGKPLYKLAREKKQDIPQITTEINIFSLAIEKFTQEEFQTDKGVQKLPVAVIKISCSSGTYIRSLAHDLGEKMHTKAFLKSLIRTKIGTYKIEDSITLEELESKTR